MSSICFVLFLIYISSASSDSVGVLNNYVDKILNNMRNQKDIVNQIDPLKAPDFYEDKFQGSNIWVRGISSLYRFDNCLLLGDEHEYIVRTNLLINNISVNMDFKVKQFFWMSGIIEASLDTVAIAFQISFDVNKGIVQLREFKVTELGIIHINKITGLSFMMDYLLKITNDYMVRNPRHLVIQVIETKVSKIIAKQVEKSNFPLQELYQ